MHIKLLKTQVFRFSPIKTWIGVSKNLMSLIYRGFVIRITSLVQLSPAKEKNQNFHIESSFYSKFDVR